jgi:hypothetical protein
MNNPHRNARMTPLGRAEMVRRIIDEGRRAADDKRPHTNLAKQSSAQALAGTAWQLPTCGLEEIDFAACSGQIAATLARFG